MAVRLGFLPMQNMKAVHFLLNVSEALSTENKGSIDQWLKAGWVDGRIRAMLNFERYGFGNIRRQRLP